MLLTLSPQAIGQIETRLIECARLQSAVERLDCYDELANSLQSTSDGADMLYVQPPQEFLAAQLRVAPENSDFDLTVNKFLLLIQNATMDNGRPILIKGWRMEKTGYSLQLKMKSPVSLMFSYEPGGNSKITVLQPVHRQGVVVDPELFVMNIAAMSP
jgi:hypothetical protein